MWRRLLFSRLLPERHQAIDSELHDHAQHDGQQLCHGLWQSGLLVEEPEQQVAEGQARESHGVEHGGAPCVVVGHLEVILAVEPVAVGESAGHADTVGNQVVERREGGEEGEDAEVHTHRARADDSVKDEVTELVVEFTD